MNIKDILSHAKKFNKLHGAFKLKKKNNKKNTK